MPPPRRRPPRSPEHAALGEAIKLLRSEADLKQEELADIADMNFNQIGRIERGQGNPSFTTLMRLTAALETSFGRVAALTDRFLAEGDGEDQRRRDSDQNSSTTRSQSASTSSAQP